MIIRRLTARALAMVAAALLIAAARAVSFEPDDPLLHTQWHLTAISHEPASANVLPAWSAATGAGVVIATVDDGLQIDHPDIHEAYVAGSSYDFNDDDADPSPQIGTGCGASDCHGTAVAGLAAARGGNGVGVSGAGPMASLAGVRLLAAPVSDEQIAAALGHDLDTTAISTNSWGPSDDGGTLSGPGPLTLAAMEHAVTSGRDGKGRVFVWAAGNGRISEDDCNFDGYASSRFVIAVGASNDAGQLAHYSESCAAMLVMAPSSGGTRFLTTTDLAGSAGYDPGEYTGTFSGTSGSAPIVSGIVALMLERNPTLSWRDVQEILIRTARKLDPSDAGWSRGPFPHHHDYGFGLVDAEAAVAAAAAWVSLPPESQVPAIERDVAIAVPDNSAAGVVDGITVGSEFAGFRVEHVEVELTASHSRRGDLEVTLTSPNGTVSQLARRRPFDTGSDFAGWRFSSVRHWGESAAGSWTLRVADREAAHLGTWGGWTLRLYGVNGCRLVLNPSSDRIAFEGGTRHLEVAAAPECSWRAESRSPWISVISGQNGTGGGTVSYSVETNTSTVSRTGQIDISGRVFTVTQDGVPTPTIRLLAPESGERLFLDTPYKITWRTRTTVTVSTLAVLFSRDGGASYEAIPGCADLPATVRQCMWSAPGPPTERGRIRVTATDMFGNTTIEDSAGNFTVARTSPWIRIVRPDTEVEWRPGEMQRIVWRHNLGAQADFRVEISRDGTRSWDPLAVLEDGGAGTVVYEWLVAGAPSSDMWIRVRWTRGPVSDISDVPVAVLMPASP